MQWLLKNTLIIIIYLTEKEPFVMHKQWSFLHGFCSLSL